MALAIITKLHHWLKWKTKELLKINIPTALFYNTSAAIDVVYELKLSN